MSRIKRIIQNWLGVSNVQRELELLHKQDESLWSKIEKISSQYEARIGIDLCWKSASTAVILARTPKGDRVEIIELKNKLTTQELQEIKDILEGKFGAKLQWLDSPGMSHPFRY